MKKLLVGVVVVAAIGAFVALNLEGRAPKGKEVEVEPVERETLTAIVEASGRLQPHVSVDLSSDVIGRVVAVHAEEGDSVAPDQLLIEIDPSPFELRVKSARAGVAAADSRLEEVRANLLRARRDHERDRALHERDLLPDSALEASAASFDALTAQLRTADHNAAQARASLEEAEEQLRKTEIRSPIAGVIIRRQVEVGEVAVSGTINNQGSLLMTVADLSTMVTEIEVDETDVVSVAEGQRVEVDIDAVPGRTFAGHVSEVAKSAIVGRAASAEGKSADYEVEVVLVDTDPRLRPGLSATARITTAVREDVLTVPIQAVVVRADDGALADASAAEEEDELEGVFVILDGEAKFRPVELGITGERSFEITSGLDGGEEVIVGPFQTLRRLEDGDQVHVEEKDDDEKDDEAVEEEATGEEKEDAETDGSVDVGGSEEATAADDASAEGV